MLASYNEIAGIIFIFAAVIIIVFHILLAIGFPLGEFAMGGKYPGKWSKKMRQVAVLVVFIWLFIILVVLINAGLVFNHLQDMANELGWMVVLFSGFQVVLHVITPSQKEQRLWLPVVIVLLIGSLVVKLA
jgi:uncharacterized membrane protein YhaH (DUF805 family)